MPLGDGVLIAGLDDVYTRLIQFLSRQGPLLIKLLAALINLFLCVQCLFRLLRVGFRLLHFFRQSGRGCSFVSSLRLVEGSLILLGSRAQGAVLENRQQLSLVNWAAALDQKFLHGGADLRNDGRLLSGIQNGIAFNHMFNGRLFDRNHLHSYARFLVAFVLRAGGNQQETTCDEEGERNAPSANTSRKRKLRGKLVKRVSVHLARSSPSEFASWRLQPGTALVHRRRRCEF